MSIAASSDPINPQPATAHTAPYGLSPLQHETLTTESDTVSIAAQLAQQCQKSRQTKRGWQVCCPAHEDTTPSLSITPVADRVLLHCFAGCTPKAIVEALGGNMRDLFTTPLPSRRLPQQQVYDYTTAEGVLLYQVVRSRDRTTGKKMFWQQRPDPDHPGRVLKGRGGVEPVLYRLPQVMMAIQRGEPIYIVEGEQDANTLTYRHLTATCNSGGAGQWLPEHSAALQRAHCIILPDHDDPGRAHAEQVATSLQGIAASVKVVSGIHTETTGSDVSDWLAVGHNLDELHARVEATPYLSSHLSSHKVRNGGNATEQAEDPHKTSSKSDTPHLSSLSSLSSQPEWPEMAPEAFSGVAGTLVATLKDHTEASPIALLLQMLTYYGTVLGRKAYYQVEATKHYSNLFTSLVGPTGKGRKGTAYDHVEHYMHNTDTSWSLLQNVTGGCGSGEGLIYAVRNPVIQRQPFRDKSRVLRYEQVMTDEGVIDKRLLVYESEFAGVLKVAGRDGNLLSVILRQAWDSGNLRNTVKGSPLRATNAHISIIGHITIDELKRYLTDDDMSNGFANRFLFPLVRRSQTLPEGGDMQNVNVHDLTNQLKTAFTAAREVEQMHRDAEATAIWKAVYPALTADKPGLVGSLLARGEAQVLRLSMLYALLDGTGTITKNHLNAALAVWQYCEDSAFYIFGKSMGDKQADTLLKDLQKHYPNGRARKAILTETFKGHLRADELDRLIDLLEDHGLISNEKVDREKGTTPGRGTQILTYKQCELSERCELSKPTYLSLSNDAISKMELSSQPLRTKCELSSEDPASADQLTADISAVDALLNEERRP